MAEEKIVKFNLKKRLVKVPRWKRKGSFMRLLKRRVKGDKIFVSSKLNESFWKSGKAAIRVKIIKDGKSVKLETVE